MDTPTADSPSSSLLGTRPAATSTWLASSSVPSASETTTPAPPRATRATSAPVSTVIPSSRRKAVTASLTSASSRLMTRSPRSTTVTSEPKRENT